MLRIKFLALFSKHIQIPAKPWTQADGLIVQAIADVLVKEEQVVGLINPATKDIEKRRKHEKRSVLLLVVFLTYSKHKVYFSRFQLQSYVKSSININSR